jgi:hypothetical protein
VGDCRLAVEVVLETVEQALANTAEMLAQAHIDWTVVHQLEVHYKAMDLEESSEGVQDNRTVELAMPLVVDCKC